MAFRSSGNPFVDLLPVPLVLFITFAVCLLLDHKIFSLPLDIGLAVVFGVLTFATFYCGIKGLLRRA